jgi:hypothetical protein
MHYDPDRSCGIRQGLGSTENLPNRSGWITLNKDKEVKLARETFRERFPAYWNTIYPVVETDKRQSFWRSDPNHPRNEASWGLAWPPISGYPPFEADPPRETPPSTPPRKRRGRKPKAPRPEDRSSSPPSQAAQGGGHGHGHGQGGGEGSGDAAGPSASSMQSNSASKRRRPQADGTFRPSPDASEDDDIEFEDIFGVVEPDELEGGSPPNRRIRNRRRQSSRDATWTPDGADAAEEDEDDLNGES